MQTHRPLEIPCHTSTGCPWRSRRSSLVAPCPVLLCGLHTVISALPSLVILRPPYQMTTLHTSLPSRVKPEAAERELSYCLTTRSTACLTVASACGHFPPVAWKELFLLESKPALPRGSERARLCLPLGSAFLVTCSLFSRALLPGWSPALFPPCAVTKPTPNSPERKVTRDPLLALRFLVRFFRPLPSTPSCACARQTPLAFLLLAVWLLGPPFPWNTLLNQVKQPYFTSSPRGFSVLFLPGWRPLPLPDYQSPENPSVAP